MRTLVICVFALGTLRTNAGAAVTGSQTEVVYRLANGETIAETVTERGASFLVDTERVTFLGNLQTSLGVLKLKGSNNDRCYITPMLPSELNTSGSNVSDYGVIDAQTDEVQNFIDTGVYADPSYVTDDVRMLCGNEIVWAVPTADNRANRTPTVGINDVIKSRQRRGCFKACVRVCRRGRCRKKCTKKCW